MSQELAATPVESIFLVDNIPLSGTRWLKHTLYTILFYEIAILAGLERGFIITIDLFHDK